MNHFGRVLKLALSHRMNVVGCVVTALGVALLWGGNLTAIYPIVEVVMNGHSLPDWVDQRIAESDQIVAENTRWLDQLDQLPADDVAGIEAAVGKEIKLRQQELNALAERAKETWYDTQLAEQTRLHNVVTQLRKLQGLPPDELNHHIALEKKGAEQKIEAYEERAERFRWLAPYAHRWLPATPFATLALVCMLVMAGTIAKGVFRIWNTIMVARLGHIVGFDLRKEYYRQVLRLDMANFTERGRGDLMNRCTSDLNASCLGVQRVFGQAMLEPLKMIVCLVLAAWISWQLLLLTIVTAPLAGYVINWLGRALKRTHRRAMQELSSIYERLSETLGGIKLIKAFTMESAERSKFHQSAKEYFRRQMKIVRYNSLVSPLTETIGISMVVAAALMGGYLVISQQTSLFGIPISDTPLDNGMMAMFFAMLAGMSDPARRLSQEFSQLQQASAAAERVYEILDREPTIVDPPQPKPLPRLTRSLRLENVSFHYQPDKQILHEVNLDVRAGETLAIVGPNGCGKTTLLQLLPRFYDPTIGRITFDGVDIRDVRLRELRLRFGLVSQEILLFNDTVAANIAYGSLDTSQQAIEAAARQAHAHTFITEKLREGYQTYVGPGGSRLSGGQRQRISLARAILRDPEVLILDEATSQIDLESEQLIYQVLRQFTRNRTTLMITHRLSTLSLADRVVVMDQGRILDVGPHDELLGRCDLYHRLCQFGYRESA